MKLDLNDMVMWMVLAKNSEKKLVDNEAYLSDEHKPTRPKNWSLKQGMMASFLPNSFTRVAYLQNEIAKEDQKINQLNRAKLNEAVTTVDEILNTDNKIISPEKKRNIYKALDFLKSDLPVSTRESIAKLFVETEEGEESPA